MDFYEARWGYANHEYCRIHMPQRVLVDIVSHVIYGF